ncbi:2-succinylbenzoate--CoA ligase [Novipirellula aureliae]|uniref:2-succinylbenzoate--CoA ligase n=1 Tax=Novipirellula aureliae TaxID=2527966 RepID=A0A5C6DXA2_9BACT|nr:fatty acid--CoA ligase family protein [Novipirellula aureliae]TWU41288.1 2-succinylbenzoate--CoA ligase [Novipirellula aureliae]
MSLQENLKRLEPTRVLWRQPIAGSTSSGDLTEWLRSSHNFFREFDNHRVALIADHDVDLAKLMVALDGRCEQILILPSTSDSSLIASMVAKARSDVVIAAGNPLPLQTIGVRVVSADEAIQTSIANGSQYDLPLRPSRWLLPTSGTTGTPKLIPHSFRSLTRSTKMDVRVGAKYAWGSLYNLRSFAGLQVFLQSWMAGSSYLFCDHHETWQQRIVQIGQLGCNALSATPTMWRMLLMSTDIRKLPLQQITLGGEIADQSILDSLRDLFPKAKMVHVYASTETGVGFVVRDGRAGFPASFIDPSPGRVPIQVDDDGHLLVGTGQEADRWIDSGDLVERVGDRYLFRGRANGVINVGGRKVHPSHVENILQCYPGVEIARAYAHKNPFTGSLVAAEVVVQDGIQVDLQAKLIAHCRERLEPYQVPVKIDVVHSIPLSSSGKLRRDARQSKFPGPLRIANKQVTSQRPVS